MGSPPMGAGSSGPHRAVWADARPLSSGQVGRAGRGHPCCGQVGDYGPGVLRRLGAPTVKLFVVRSFRGTVVLAPAPRGSASDGNWISVGGRWGARR